MEPLTGEPFKGSLRRNFICGWPEDLSPRRQTIVCNMQIMARRLFGRLAAAGTLVLALGTGFLAAEPPSPSLDARQTDRLLEERLAALAATHHGQATLVALQLEQGKT